MCVELSPFIYIDKNVVKIVTKLIRKHTETLWPILSINHIAYTTLYKPQEAGFTFGGPESAFSIFSDGSAGSLYSPSYYFPVDMQRGMDTLIPAFVALYPIVDSIVSIEEGSTPRLAEMLAKFQGWCVEKWREVPPENGEEVVTAGETDIQIPELDSYTYVRAGLWWEVLARDKWTCCSCGRSTQRDGIVLHVDHILPRSKGGTDEIDNLQTLCDKCNIGKSNRDDTDLRNERKRGAGLVK